MCAYHLQPLPFRRLVEYANGLWDETRKTFYPFILANSNVAGKNGVHYYLSSASISFKMEGIQASSQAYLSCKLSGNTVYPCYVKSPAMTQATDYWSEVQAVHLGFVTDAGSPLTVVAASAFNIIYAEIPADDAGGVLVVNDR
jgi:hypothetical protein